MKALKVHKTGVLPKEIHALLRSLYQIGFFSHSLLAGSWVFPLYKAVFNIRYALKTFDIDFAIDLISLGSAKPVNMESLLKDLVAEKMLVQGFHYPFPALAHVEKTATGYREIPVAWNPTI